MNATLTRLAVALILLGSTSAFSGQPFGRDSVYAEPRASAGAPARLATGKLRFGRSSVYVYDLPAPAPAGEVRTTLIMKPGRA